MDTATHHTRSIVMERLVQPLISTIVHNAEVKALFAIAGTAALQVVERLLPALKTVLYQEPLFVMALGLLIAADVATGIGFRVVLRRETRISSAKMVAGATKIVLYIALVTGASMIENAMDGTALSLVTDVFDELAYFYCMSAEFISILENISGNPDQVRQMLRRIWRLKKLDGDENPFDEEKVKA